MAKTPEVKKSESSSLNSNSRGFDWIICAFLLIYLLLVYSSTTQPFFWDTLTQASKWAHWYFDNSFDQLFLPSQLDAGHPPFFAIYLAFLWKLFGKSLWVSHLAVLPFVLGIVWQVNRLLRSLVAEHYRFWLLLLILSDATLLAQATLVSPDLVLCFGLLLALNGIREEKYSHLALGAICCGLVSIRGIFVLASLLLFIVVRACFYLKTNYLRFLVRPLLYLFPVSLLIGLYYGLHYYYTGWLLFSPNDSWSGHRSFVGMSEMIRNAGILGWRLIDFGRIGVWIVLLICVLRIVFTGKSVVEGKSCNILLYIFSFLLAFSPVLVLLSNPVAHRYLLPLFLLISLMAGLLLIRMQVKSTLFKGIVIAMTMVQLSGHLWVYPRHIAQGWDASLAFRPYFELREEMIDYLEEQDLEINEIGTEFPNIGPVKYLDLSEQSWGFASKDLAKQQYIFYANVFNDFSDEELLLLENKWIVEKYLKKGGVEVILYRKEKK